MTNCCFSSDRSKGKVELHTKNKHQLENKCVGQRVNITATSMLALQRIRNGDDGRRTNADEMIVRHFLSQAPYINPSRHTHIQSLRVNPPDVSQYDTLLPLGIHRLLRYTVSSRCLFFVRSMKSVRQTIILSIDHRIIDEIYGSKFF